VSGQAKACVRLYYDVINGKALVDPLRAFARQPIVDLYFAIDHVMQVQLPLDWATLKHSGIDLVVLASSADERSTSQDLPVAVSLRDFRDRRDTIDALHASSCLPVLGGGPVRYRGARLWDGGLIEPIPVHSALADGCTHVLSVESARDRSSLRHLSIEERMLGYLILPVVGPRLVGAYRARYDRYNFALRSESVQVIRVDRHTPPVGLLERRRAHLLRAATAGGLAVSRMLRFPAPAG
jgi:predicted patatin/cPLA2 family phospholipase